MASFANSLRHLLGRVHAPSSSNPDSIARFDGTSDGHIHLRQMHESVSLQEGGTVEAATANRSATHLPGRHDTVGRGHAFQPAIQLHQSQSTPQFAVQQGGDGGENMQGLMHFTQEIGPAGHSQYDESLRQISSRTATTQPSPRFHGGDRPHVMHFEGPDASTEVEVKQEPASHEHDDRHLFAEFTNEDIDDDGAQTNAENQQPAKSADNAAINISSIKREPHSESELPFTVTRRAETFDSTITKGRSPTGTPAMMVEQGNGASTSVTPRADLKNGTFAARFHSEPEHLHLNTPSDLPTHTKSQQQYSFEQYAHGPQQSASNSQVQPNNEKNLRSPSADSVVGAQRHSSEETVSSLSGMDLAANASLLEQQWKDRYKLSGMSPLTAEVVQANPILLHCPRPLQEQYGQRPPHQTLANQPHPSHSIYQTQPANGLQHSSTFPYNFNVHPAYPVAAQRSQVHSHWMPPGSHSAPSTLQPEQVPLTQGSIGPHHVTEMQDAEIYELSDDDEPLATRAIRHPSTTAPPNAQETTNSSLNLNPTTAACESGVPDSKQNSVIELSDNGNETTETISWKLPDFEVTYHPPATDNDLPMAKVSILGRPNNLVRSEVALTEDHAHEEMELFLNVFLPAQQALQTPDPEPAHAVINFHTISVMVLEAFVQYEIGDEMGRGYGFHGGNLSNQALRPSPSSPDSEPTRTRSAKDADVDEIFFAVIDRWRAGLISGKGTSKLIRGCQEFCDIALDVIHYVKEHGLSQPEPKKRKERSDKGVKRGPRVGEKQTETKPKTLGKRKAGAMENKTSAKKEGKVNELSARKRAKIETNKKPMPTAKSSGVTVTVTKGNK